MAAQKVRTLLQYTSDIRVAALQIGEDVRRLPVEAVERPYAPDLLEGMGLVYACTDDRELNRRIATEARGRGIPANAADDPAFCDFTSPAIYRRGNMSVAVSSNAQDVRRAVAWRNAIRRLDEGGALPETAKDVAPAASALSGRRLSGKVWLVGFGPGDPELLTFKADRILRDADVIYYDDLVDPEVLRRFKGRAVYVGKRESQHAVEQESINEVLAQSALKGETVVRLKGGDPSIFGRAGEELAHLTRLGIEVEVVPGITAACAAAASAVVPLTHRGISSEVVLRTGHGSVEGDGRPDARTLVYYMSASRLSQVVAQLLAEGWPPTTPAVLVRSASLPHQKVAYTRIGELTPEEWDSPLILIVGRAAIPA